MTSLKSLLDQRQSIDEQLMEAYGVVSPEMEKALTEIEIHLPEKVDRYAGLLDRLKQDCELFKMKSEKYLKAARAIENLQNKLIDNVKQQMLANGLNELRGNDDAFKLSKGKPKVIVESTAALPKKFIIETIEQKPDKDSLREALQKGEILPGVSLETTYTLKRGFK